MVGVDVVEGRQSSKVNKESPLGRVLLGVRCVGSCLCCFLELRQQDRSLPLPAVLAPTVGPATPARLRFCRLSPMSMLRLIFIVTFVVIFISIVMFVSSGGSPLRRSRVRSECSGPSCPAFSKRPSPMSWAKMKHGLANQRSSWTTSPQHLRRITAGLVNCHFPTMSNPLTANLCMRRHGNSNASTHR